MKTAHSYSRFVLIRSRRIFRTFSPGLSHNARTINKQFPEVSEKIIYLFIYLSLAFPRKLAASTTAIVHSLQPYVWTRGIYAVTIVLDFVNSRRVEFSTFYIASSTSLGYPGPILACASTTSTASLCLRPPLLSFLV